jgi:hypothetical protein
VLCRFKLKCGVWLLPKTGLPPNCRLPKQQYKQEMLEHREEHERRQVREVRLLRLEDWLVLTEYWQRLLLGHTAFYCVGGGL